MIQKIQQAFSQQRLLGGAFVLALTQFGASAVGLLRDRALNQTFPGLSTVDVYISSFRLSDLLFQVTIMAGLSTVLVPLLARYKANDDHHETSALLSGVMSVGSIAFGLMAVVLAVFFDQVAPALVQFSGEDLELYILFGRLALLTNALFVVGNALGQYLITVQKYWIYGITPILYTCGTIAGTYFLVDTYGQLAPMIGTVVGAIAYVVVRLVGAIYAGFRPMATWWHPDLKKMGWLMLPRMLALGALQMELLVFDRLASGLDAGSITINANARNFQSAVVGVIGIALAQSAFPLLSNAIAKNDWKRFGVYVRKGVGMVLLLTIPGAIVLVLASPIAASLVHLNHVLQVFSAALLLYALSIPFESLNHLLLRAFYAMHRTGFPAVISVLNGFSAIIATGLLVNDYGVYSLPIGFLIGQVVQVTGLSIALKMRRDQ